MQKHKIISLNNKHKKKKKISVTTTIVLGLVHPQMSSNNDKQSPFIYFCAYFAYMFTNKHNDYTERLNTVHVYLQDNVCNKYSVD